MPQIQAADYPGSPIEGVVDDKEKAANKVANDDTLSDPEKIEALAKIRGWFSAHHPDIDAYLAGELTAVEAADKIAPPIEEAYSTGNHGYLRYSAEETARHQRGFFKSPEKAAEEWGWPEDVAKPELGEDYKSTEMHLWDLWYAVIHASKKIPWNADTEQAKLLNLVKALKARPDPPLPENTTIAMKREWVWQPGVLWSKLNLLGPASTECLNDCCGCGAGWTPPEQRAWANFNAFMARMTAGGLYDWANFFMYAMEDALESKPSDQGSHVKAPSLETKMSSDLTVAAVWVLLAGDWLYENRLQDDGGVDGDKVDLALRDTKLPWMLRKKQEFVRRVLSAGRWTFWRRRFAQEAENGKLDKEVRDLCSRAAEKIAEFAGK